LNTSNFFPSPLRMSLVGALTVIGPLQVVVKVVHKTPLDRSRISMEFVLWTTAKAKFPPGTTAMLSVAAGRLIVALTDSRTLSMTATCAVVLLDTTETLPGIDVAITFAPGLTVMA